MKRRTFIQNAVVGASGLLLEPWTSWAYLPPEKYKLTILHTNDVHSRIDPFPETSGQYAGLGGAARRASLVGVVRKQEPNVLLLDAGDMLQGTPYFNQFDGEVEFAVMNAMGYDAATLGNHDFDGGMELLKRRLPGMQFSLLSANYDFSNSILAGQIAPYKVFHKGPLRIGVFGLGIELVGLVPDKLFRGTTYTDPLPVAVETTEHLKNVKKCHLIVCLSHLGYQYSTDKVSDMVLAKQTKDIDIIIGGHTHTMLEVPQIVSNSKGKPVHIVQVGWGGAYLGRLDIFFERNYKHRCITCQPVKIGS